MSEEKLIYDGLINNLLGDFPGEYAKDAAFVIKTLRADKAELVQRALDAEEKLSHLVDTYQAWEMSVAKVEMMSLKEQRDAMVEALEWAIGYAPRNEPEYEQAEKALQTYYYAQLDEL